VSCGLRDVLELETLDTPALLVASDAFVQAAGDQACKLGQTDIRRTFVAHPVQDRTDDELREAARSVVEDVLIRLCSSSAG
jgi:hypothetical protein